MTVTELEPFEFTDGLSGTDQPGDGDKVLWLHGYTLNSRSWSDLWARLPGWHHIGIDLPGHGASAPMTAFADLQDLGRKLGAACVEHGVRHIVALSFGTLTAIQVAIEFPDAFASFTFGGPTIAGGPQDAAVGVVYTEMLRAYADGERAARLQELWMSSPAWEGIDEQPQLRAKLGALVASHSWAELGTDGVRRFLWPHHDEPDLARIQVPVLVLVGDMELPAFRATAAILQRTLPDCASCELTATHHLCMLESPDQAAPAIDAHLRAHAAKLP